MAHYTAFVISNVQLLPEQTPSIQQLREAARHVGDAAIVAPLYKESLSVGGHSYRFIQGEYSNNKEMFGYLPYQEWPEMDHCFYSDRSGRVANAEDAPPEILQNSWNVTDTLVKTAVESCMRQTFNNPHRSVFPRVIVTPEGSVCHDTDFPDRDVFGEFAEIWAPEQPVAKRYFPHQDAYSAHFTATYPLMRLATAKFQVDYIRTLAKYPRHLVIQMDWNA